MIALRPGFIKRADIARFSSQRHRRRGAGTLHVFIPVRVRNRSSRRRAHNYPAGQ